MSDRKGSLADTWEESGKVSVRTSGEESGVISGKTAGKVSGKVGYGRRGRPSEKPKKQVFQLRMDEEECDLLDLISYATADTKSNVIRKALKLYASVKKDAY